jgi:hypothetical protein
VFHVSLLKRYQTNEGIVEPKQVELPLVTVDGVIILEPQIVLDCRWLKQGTQIVTESLV